jgi:hypothetical protein
MALLDSARDRKTAQGVVVFEKVLELLDKSEVEEPTAEVLRKLNRSLIGIEAHGYLTNDEYQRVLALRNLET